MDNRIKPGNMHIGASSTGIGLSETQKLDWLQLIRSENVGPATFRDLINHFGTARSALDALPELSGRSGKKNIKITQRQEAEREYERVLELGGSLIGMGETQYPQYLKAIDYPPPLISVLGSMDCLQYPPIGIVGARNSSLSGIKLATIFAKELGKSGHAIISGLARGIDTAAHSAAIETGTIAVVAGGLDIIYPPENKELQAALLERGNAVITEMPLGWKPRAPDFPRRNRIIAGISLAVIVIEAAKRSGSLITARLANECGRLVFAVPGSPLDPRSAGANSLLKSGASVASEPLDVSEAVKHQLERTISNDDFDQTNNLFSGLEDEEHLENTISDEHTQNPTQTSNNIRKTLITALGPTPVHIDELVRHTGISIGEVQLVLIELDLAGELEHHPGNQVSIILDG